MSTHNILTGIRCLGDRVIVERQAAAEKSQSGIYLTGEKPPEIGVVVAVGNGQLKEDGTRQMMEIQVGDRILFGKYSGTETRIQGKDYLVMSQTDIIGVLQADLETV